MKDDLKIANYCLCFIDILGQLEQYKNEGLLPPFKSNEEKDQFRDKIKKTIIPIDDLQKTSEDMLRASTNYESPLRKSLDEPQKHIYDKMNEESIKQQRWSDGLVYFVSLLEGNVKCPMAGIYKLFSLSGNLCYLGLAKKRPLRGAIDIAWALELHDGELYGAAVAKAYELESKVAQYPRIVVGKRTVDYLMANINNPLSDIYTEYNRNLSKTCLNMLASDADGYHFIHYLGNTFNHYVSDNALEELYNKALAFVTEQCDKWHNEHNTKLALRYSHLYSYFLEHNPNNE